MSVAVLAYPESDNLGDPIQSIAAEKLLGIDVDRIDRDQLHIYNGAPTQLLMNGWFMEKPQHWPPSNKIHPIFISFHINPTAADQMLTAKGINYLKKYQPIGCRDHYTKMLLESHGIKAYFSSCLTLTLQKSDFEIDSTQNAGILVLSVLERMKPQFPMPWSRTFFKNGWVQWLKAPLKILKYYKAQRALNRYLSRFDMPIQQQTQIVSKSFSLAQKQKLATAQLTAIAQAKLVVTSRIHTALPAVAMGIPVLFISDGLEHPNHQSRLKGLTDYFPVYQTKNLKNIEAKIPDVSTKHLKKRKALIETVNEIFSKNAPK